ncbi:hypothetical protein [Bradyrhizobium sp. BR 10289]|uniref:hypothetical protein n=1 Tax=Bradyrhizobium sp. BR 10289 TaxID=2749993 RepID=UPI001C64950E|nr:hypothetical protein [Bradyrhizobium sp. BR 10289]MBW7968946.1 hypothetical protein [Bradyrhizobium sp. BR 10289]
MRKARSQHFGVPAHNPGTAREGSEKRRGRLPGRPADQNAENNPMHSSDAVAGSCLWQACCYFSEIHLTRRAKQGYGVIMRQVDRDVTAPIVLTLPAS